MCLAQGGSPVTGLGTNSGSDDFVGINSGSGGFVGTAGQQEALPGRGSTRANTTCKQVLHPPGKPEG